MWLTRVLSSLLLTLESMSSASVLQLSVEQLFAAGKWKCLLLCLVEQCWWGEWGLGGKGSFYVIRQLLYFSDKCVFLLAKVSYLSLTTCKDVFFSRAGQSHSVVEDTNDLISAECSCRVMFLLCIVKTWLAFLYMRSLCHGLEPCLPKTEAKAYFRHPPCYARVVPGCRPPMAKESGCYF